MIKFPILYHQEKARKWKMWVEDGCIYKTDGLTKKDFTKEPSCRQVEAKGKNTIDEQALQNAQRDFVKKLDEGYRPDPSDVDGTKMVKEILEKKKAQGGNNHGVSGSNKGKLKNTESDTFLNLDTVYEAMLAHKYSEKTKSFLWTAQQKKEVLDKLNKIESKKNKSLSLEEISVIIKKRFREEYFDASNGAFLQPKLDGCRNISFIDKKSGQLATLTRGGKQWKHLSKQKAEIKKFLEKYPDVVLDGEFYVHTPTVGGRVLKGAECFRFITTCCKTVMTNPNPNEDLIEYHVYDIVCNGDDKDMNQKKRLSLLREMFANFGEPLKYVKPVALKVVNNEEDLLRWQNYFYIEHDYEGVMLRNPLGKYMQDKRSLHLLKYKDFEDEEFVIKSCEKAEGTKAGCAVWVCETNNGSGETFKCSMKCNVEEGRNYYNNYADYLGEKLTVKFQGKSAEGIPRFPVGISVREEGT